MLLNPNDSNSDSEISHFRRGGVFLIISHSISWPQLLNIQWCTVQYIKYVFWILNSLTLMCFLPTQWVMAVLSQERKPLLCLLYWAKVLTNIGSITQMHQHSSVKPSEERTCAHASLCPSGIWKHGRLFFFFLFFFFCIGMTLPSVLTQECIESIFSSLHQKGRRCQVVQQSQRFSEKQQQGEWTINSVIPLQTKTVSYSREKEGITGE